MSTSSSTPLFANKRHIPDIIPEKEAYDIAKKSGVRDEEKYNDKDDGGESDDAREVLGSINGDLSVECSSVVALGAVAVVRIVGSA